MLTDLFDPQNIEAALIDDDTPLERLITPERGRGLEERDYIEKPAGYCAAAPEFNMPVLPREEIAERVRENWANKATLHHLRHVSGPNGGHIPSLWQNGVGYCWNHSVVSAAMLLRAKMGLDYVPLSAFAGAWKIKRGRNQGGWSPEGVQYAFDHGIPSQEFWPQPVGNNSSKAMSGQWDTPACWENAKLHKLEEGWMDLSSPYYDRNIPMDQALTAAVLNCPGTGDFYWWGHSVCIEALTFADHKLVDPKTSKAAFAALPDLKSLDFNNPRDRKVFGDLFAWIILNSHGDRDGVLGERIISGKRMILDGGTFVRTVTPSKN